MSDIDIIDQIDALVDEQLANFDNRSGYDHSVNQERCRCGRDWHGLPITKRMDGMRSFGEFDPGYVYAEDDSPVMCVGSNTPGPWRQAGLWQLPDYPFAASGRFDYESAYQAAARHVDRLIGRMDSGYRMPTPVRHRVYDGPATGQWWRCDNPQELEVVIDSNSERDDLRSGLDYSVRRHSASMSITTPAHPDRDPFSRRTEVIQLGFDPDTHNFMRYDESNRRPVWLEVFTDRRPPIGDWHPVNPPSAGELIRAAITMGIEHEDETEPDTRMPQQRALPRPSTTPPMWANDPTRSRRPRRNRNQPNRQGIA